MKCEKCGIVSFDYLLECPNPKCGKDLRSTRKRLGIYLQPPETDFESFFAGGSGLHRVRGQEEVEVEMEMDDEDDDEIEFSLDD